MKSARMLPKKYHAIAFLSILVMLLLLGLHLLGFGFLSGGSGAGSLNAAAALARNSTGGSSSPAGASSTLNPNAVYRHPIVYDKLTGATNNQIQDVLGVGSKQDQFPLDHYQRQQQQHQHQLNQNHFESQFGAADPFASHLGQSGRGFRHPLDPPPPPPPLPHPLGPPLGRHHLPPPPMPMPPVHMMTTTTQSPQSQSQQPAPAEPRSQHQDSLPSASSLNNNVGETRPLNSSQPPPQLAHYYQQQQEQQQQQQQPQQPVYYTPPIFTYSSNFDALQQPGAGQPPPPPLGVPEVPLSVDEFNLRQNRLRQLGGATTTTTNNNNNGQDDRQPVNLLADPQAQQRHKQQMLDRQLLFGPPAPSNHHQFGPQPIGSDNFTSTATYYPDPALYQRHQLQPVGSIRPPYATQSPSSFAAPVATQLESPSKLATSQKQLLQPQMRPLPPPSVQLQSQRPTAASNQQQAPAQVRSGQQAPLLQQVGSSPVGGRPSSQEPTCARQLQSGPVSAELANSSSQLPVLFCNQDSEYPTSEVMRALELYASERSIEQLIPQQLVQMLTQTRATSPELQRQLTLDPLQANVARTGPADQPPDQQVFPSSNYESLCSATTWIAQPRRAKTLGGQWKIVVNLPGHKYRGIAISQMVRLEECQKPNGECSLGGSGGGGSGTQASANQLHPRLPRPRSRCLQAYGNQRLLAWSHQQGLHFDLFRVPVACSCHIRRSP